KTIDLFFQIHKPNDINLIIFFNACAELGDEKGFKLGKQIYSKLLSNRKLLSEKVAHSILNMFSKYSDIESTKKLFPQLNRNEMTYGLMMNMYNKRNEPKQTLNLYEEMKREKIQPNEQIYFNS
ncbi:unnamed protein product, partial [Adineta steineri]